MQDLVDAGLSAHTFRNLRLKTGNTGHTDLPTDLVQFVEDGLIKQGSMVALWVPGLGDLPGLPGSALAGREEAVG